MAVVGFAKPKELRQYYVVLGMRTYANLESFPTAPSQTLILRVWA